MKSFGTARDENDPAIIGAFYEVANELGFGYLEHVYVLALEIELRERGHAVCCSILGPSARFVRIVCSDSRKKIREIGETRVNPR
jgi:PD-(D/E)XK nuclease superfamily